MNRETKMRGFWPTVLTALVAQHPAATTAELARLAAPELTGAPFERKRKAAHQALMRLAVEGCVRVRVSIEHVGTRRIAICRWYPLAGDMPEPVTTADMVLSAVRQHGRLTPTAIHRRTGIAYSTLYKLCRRLEAGGTLVNVAPAPYQCWTTADGDRTPWHVPPSYHPTVHDQQSQRTRRRPPPRGKTPPPYINPIRARALGLPIEGHRAR